MGRRDLRTYLADVIESSDALVGYVEGVAFEGYAADRKTRAAVEREFIVIGEAVARLLRERPDLDERISDARAIVGFRNVVVHGYAEVEDKTVWQMVTVRVPVLVREAQALLEEIER